MPGSRATPQQRERFWELTKAGVSVRQASLTVGMSDAWGRRLLAGLPPGVVSITQLSRKLATDTPAPKKLKELRPEVAKMLKPGGFNDCCEAFLARRPSAWREEAAFRVVEWLTDRSEKTYADINTPPGAGKSTLFTCDIPFWLICGGGFGDPELGRAIRIMLGHETKKVATDYVRLLRRILTIRKPFWDKEQRRGADLVPTQEFGRFKPIEAEGEESVWQVEQFLVAQIGELDLYEKEPTVQAASYTAGFIGERVDFASWDDLATVKNSSSPEQADKINNWVDIEAETRIEPGGVFLLVGQRLSSIDLHRKRLDEFWVDEEGGTHPKYEHIVFPVHNELTCDGNHRQWDLRNEGCLLDDYRFPWKEIQKIQHSSTYRTVYQQEDSDPETTLIQNAWLDGGMDPFGFEAIGCYDRERDFYDIPEHLHPDRFVNYAVVDPSVSGWWAIEWWAALKDDEMASPYDWRRYLIYGRRAKMLAGGPNGFLDFDPSQQDHVGMMHELQVASMKMGMPIRTWVIESNAAHKYLFAYDHFRRWRQRFPWVQFIRHETQKNKHDPQLGVEAKLPMAYRSGLKRLPGGVNAMNYLKTKRLELTTYPHSPTSDTVMADWFGELHLPDTIRSARAAIYERKVQLPASLPPYLLKQRREMTRAR